MLGRVLQTMHQQDMAKISFLLSSYVVDKSKATKSIVARDDESITK